jgi:hypothetical protein
METVNQLSNEEATPESITEMSALQVRPSFDHNQVIKNVHL